MGHAIINYLLYAAHTDVLFDHVAFPRMFTLIDVRTWREGCGNGSGRQGHVRHGFLNTQEIVFDAAKNHRHLV